MMDDDRDRPGILGDMPMKDYQEQQFQQRSGLGEAASPPKPGQKKADTKVKTVEACCRGGAGHAQPPVPKRD